MTLARLAVKVCDARDCSEQLGQGRGEQITNKSSTAAFSSSRMLPAESYAFFDAWQSCRTRVSTLAL